MYLKELPEGTVVPPGSRVVRDFYPRPGRKDDGFGIVCGFSRERITADPDDHGVKHPIPEVVDDDFVAPPDDVTPTGDQEDADWWPRPGDA
jgi:hypothetical protein